MWEKSKLTQPICGKIDFERKTDFNVETLTLKWRNQLWVEKINFDIGLENSTLTWKNRF